MAKGLDNKFLHYGIRKEDMSLIEALCERHELDFNWVSEEILRKYHAKKVDAIEKESGRNRNNRHGDGSRHQSGHPANPIRRERRQA